MTEEINEDNCVLSKDELMLVCKTFGGHWSAMLAGEQDESRKTLTKIWDKIYKLNDLVKEAKQK